MAIPHASPVKPPLLALVGPTASGKTAVARALAKKIPSVLISCDSMQVYKGMPILTQASADTRLSEFLDPSRDYSAAQYRVDAEKEIARALKQKKLPILVGGTGLYLRALLDGLFESDGPASDLKYRQKLLDQAAKRPAGYLHGLLKKADPARAAQIHPNDSRRLLRALEVFHLTGKRMSEQLPAREGIRGRHRLKVFLLEPDRPVLYERINRRVKVMIRQGLPAEIKKLGRKKLSRTAEMALGLRQMKAVLAGEKTLPEAVEEIQKFTRHYAKRQLSWFRRERDIIPIAVPPLEKPARTAARILELWKQ